MSEKGYRSKGFILLFTILALAMSTAAVAQYCGDNYQGRPCQPTTDNCADLAVTSITVQAGGEGSVGTEDSCQNSPAVDADGNIVETDIEFAWSRTPTLGTLTFTVDNVSCDMVEGVPGSSDITYLWFNIPDEIAGCSLKTALLDGVNVCGDASCDTTVNKGWELGGDTNGEGCLGDFDLQLFVQGQPNQLGASPGQQLIMTLECSGADLSAVTACDIANDGSVGEIGERSAKVALHFQNTDDANILSNKVSSNCQEDLYVSLADFTATGSSESVLLEWSTHLEVDNAGFFVLRRDMVNGRTTRLNAGLIPAAGDLFEGAYYSLTDDTAVNGVQYEYLLVDVELSGLEGQHPGIAGVANPRNSRINLLAPTYGSSELRTGERPTFQWDPGNIKNTTLVFSTDPTFSSAASTLVVRGGHKGSLTLSPSKARNLEELAATNGGLFYWRVIESKLTRGGMQPSTQTFAASFGVN